MDDRERFAIRVDGWLWPLLALFGVSGERRFIQLGADEVEVCFGFWRHRFPRAHLVGARAVKAHLLWGIGWHTDLVRTLVVNGSLGGMVELRFEPPERYRLLRLPGRCSRLLVSLEQPEELVRTVGAA